MITIIMFTIMIISSSIISTGLTGLPGGDHPGRGPRVATVEAGRRRRPGTASCGRVTY